MRLSQPVKFIVVFGAGLTFGLLTSSFIFQKTVIHQNFDFPKTIEKENEINVSLMVDFSDGKIITCNQKLVKGSNVLNLLEICSKDKNNPFELKYSLHPEWGAFVEKIGDKENGQDNKYWQFWVNNQYAQVGASQFQLKNGDIVEWKFTR